MLLFSIFNTKINPKKLCAITKALTENMETAITEIKVAIDKNGGIQDPKNKQSYYYVIDSNPQLRLFD